MTLTSRGAVVSAPLLHALTAQFHTDRVVPLTGFIDHSLLSRIHRLEAGGRHFDSWHTDLDESRTLGMSVNLSAEPYEGGVFEIREEGAAPPLTRIANTDPGDAIVFAIEDGLEHRVTPVKGCVAKTAFAGWFGSDRPYEVPR